MRPTALLSGLLILFMGWAVLAAGAGMLGHMLSHMATVAVACPFIAYGIAGTRADPAASLPSIVAPLPMSLIELLVVWSWHLPAARTFVSSSVSGLVLEQGMFLIAGLLLWSACLGARRTGSSGRRATGVIALLLTTIHMTLLGTLIATAPRVLFAGTGFTCLGVTLSPLVDQQLGGVVMLLVGAGSYLLGGLALLFSILREDTQGAAHP